MPAESSYPAGPLSLAYSRQPGEYENCITLSRSTPQCKEDLTMWHTLLKHWNGVSLFLDIACTSAPDLLLYTDASGTLGFGGFFQGQWFQGRWPPELEDHIPDHELSMAYKELVPIVAAAEIWGRHWSRKRILFLCDNQATCAVLNKGRSRCSVIMQLIRPLTVKAAWSQYISLQKRTILQTASHVFRWPAFARLRHMQTEHHMWLYPSK